ncbi:MAG: hypothetical protein QOE75_1844 [Solirubrobacterales bacterium]|jgi:anti-anti-sigma regulatory factor|nr:hypothetical protein [Solirubrobacterales bacterium]
MQRFKLTEVPTVDGERELRVEGELDLAVADRLQGALDEIDSKSVLIDLSACDFIDSTENGLVFENRDQALSKTV